MDLQVLIEMLGMSERDPRLEALLKSEAVKLPLRRPKRDEDQVNVEIKRRPIELVFVPATSAFTNSEKFAEGELVLHTVFVFFGTKYKDDAVFGQLPWGLRSDTSRAQARTLLGPPAWSSPVLKSDRWDNPSIQVFLDFEDDEKQLEQLSIALAPQKT